MLPPPPVQRTAGVFVNRLVVAVRRILSHAGFPLLVGLLLGLPLRVAAAHEVPSRVLVTAIVRVDGGLLRAIVRVPLNAMRDVDFPLRGGGLLDMAQADSALHDAAQLWIASGLVMRAGDTVLGAPRVLRVRASLPTDGAFVSYAAALAQLNGAPLPPTTDIPAPQAMLDVLLEWPTPLAAGTLSADPQWAHLGVETTTVLRFTTDGSTERALTWLGTPGPVQLDPRWWHAAWRFVRWGVTHMLGGIDHILFVLCLVAPVRQLRPLVGIVTAFTVAHSITLGASALGYAPTALWFPPLVEVLIAASIVYMALENLVGATLHRRWMMAFAFGLIHGFGFSGALRDTLQFAGNHLLVALAAFNIGVELAQLGVLVVALPVLNVVFSRIVPERTGVLVLSALIAHEAWHWMTSRFETLREYRFSWPVLDAALAVVVIRVAMAGIAVGAVAWGLSLVLARWSLVPIRRSATLALLLAGSSIALAPRDVRAQVAPRSTAVGVYTAEQATKGREVFNGACLGCHTTATHMGPAFQQRWFGRSLAELFDYVSNLMPKAAPASLSEDEYVWVVAYILRLNGMPPGRAELTADPTWMRAVRIDSLAASVGRGHSIGNRSSPSVHGVR